MARVLTVLAHGDADGSAAVVKAALAGEYEAVRVYFTHPVDLAKDFGAFAEGDVYIVDVAVDEKTADEVRRAFRSYGGRVVYIDHHPLSVDLPGVEVVHELGSSASELTYRHLGGRLPRLYSRVALYGAIGDYLDHTDGWRRRWRLGIGGSCISRPASSCRGWSGRGRTTSLSGLWLTTWRGTRRLRPWSAS